MVSAGAVLKHCDDIMPILKVLTNEKASLLKLDSPVDLKKLKYYYVNNTDDMRSSAIQLAVKECFDKLVNLLLKLFSLLLSDTSILCDSTEFWRT